MNILIYAMNIITHSKLAFSDNQGSDNRGWTVCIPFSQCFIVFICNCNIGCEFYCGDGCCVPYSYVCDGETDCYNGKDEYKCGENHTHTHAQTQMNYTHTHTQARAHTHTRSHTNELHTHTHSSARTHTQTHMNCTHTHTQARAHSHTHTKTLAHTHRNAHTHTHRNTRSHTHRNAHTHTHACIGYASICSCTYLYSCDQYFL